MIEKSVPHFLNSSHAVLLHWGYLRPFTMISRIDIYGSRTHVFEDEGLREMQKGEVSTVQELRKDTDN